MRERLLAVLVLFFGMVAVLLTGVGLFGVLDYSVLQRRREIGIRRAIGAQGTDIARNVTAEVFGILLALPAVTIAAAALLAAVPAVLHAVKIDPASMLRSE